MKLFVFLLLFITTSVFAQDIEVKEVSEEDPTALMCRNYSIEINLLSEEDKISKAHECQTFYTEELRMAIKQINKKEKIACDFMQLKEEVSLFNEIIASYLNANTPDPALLEQMQDFYREMYTSENISQCDDDILSVIKFNQYVIENSEIPQST